MTIFGGSAEQPPEGGELVPERRELETYAHIEGLCGEEAALLAVPAHERDEHQHDRLRAISAELDRVWERMRERADRLGKAHTHDDAGA
jgi:hypothetical protein